MFMPPVFPAHWHVSQPVLIADTFCQEGQRGKQRQQAADEQSLVLAQEAQPDGRAEAGEGWKAGGAAHRGNDAAERAGFIGNACHQSHEAALAVVVGLLAHCLTLDG